MLYPYFFKNRFEIAFILTAAVGSKVFDLKLGLCLDLLDEPSKFAIDCSGRLVVDCSDPTPVCVFVKEGEK